MNTRDRYGPIPIPQRQTDEDIVLNQNYLLPCICQVP
jgi:hypothetical protein